MTLKEIQALAKVMQKNGIVSVKTPEIEMLVQPIQRQRRFRKQKGDPMGLSPSNDFHGYTDEEVLAWSGTSKES